MIYCKRNKEAILAKVQYFRFWHKMKCMCFFPTAWKKIWLCKKKKVFKA